MILQEALSNGKGFAVVAEEVKNLTQRSAAARETTGMIEDSIKKVKGGTEIAVQTAAAPEVQKTVSIIDNIAEACKSQASAVTQINKGIEEVSQVIQTNSATAEESDTSSEELSGQASMLHSTVSQYNLRKQSEVCPLV